MVTAGNHDHGLAAGWIDARLQTEPAGFLGLEQHFERPRPARPRPRGGGAARAAAVRLPRPVAARRRLRLPRPLRRRPRHRPDLRAHPRRRDGQMGRPAPESARRRTTTRPCCRRCTPGCTRSRSAPTTRSCRKGGGASSRSYRALTVERSPRSLALKTGYRAAVRTPQLARARPTAVEPVTDRAAARLPAAASPKCIRRLGPRRGARHLGPLAPLRPVADRRPRRVAGQRHADRQHGLVGLPAALPHPEVNGSPYWPGTAVLVTDTGPPQLLRLLGDRGARRTQAARPGVKQVA